MKKTILSLLFLFGFAFGSFGQASLCEEATSVSLPYSTTDDTANYGNVYTGTPGDFSSCGTPNNFLGGNDVVYAYTANFDGSINLQLSTASSYVGLFAYGSCSDIGQNCLAAAVMEDSNSAGYLSIEAFSVTNGQTYYFVVSSWPEPQTVTYHLNIAANTCVNPTATYTVLSDCGVTDQYLVAVNIDNLGSATSLTITDNQDSLFQNVTAPGIVTFGPYPNGTPATFTIANDQDANCFITSAPQNQVICAPLNNFCSNAIDLGQETSPINGTTIGATNQNTTSCATNRAAGDVYYSIVVPHSSTLTIAATAVDYDAMVTVFFGDCENQIELSCFDDDLYAYTYYNNTGSEQTFYWVQDGFNAQTGTFTLAWSMSNCVIPEALYTVVPDCTNGEQFLVTAEVYTLGSATSVTVSDDQGSAPQALTEIGQLQFGPYTNGTQVTFTTTNNDDSDCFLVGQPVTQETCPPTCINATVNINPFFNCPTTNSFFVNVEVTDLGTASAIQLSDDQGSDVQGITATGTYQFGPYVDYTTVIFTVADAINGDCILNYTVQSFSNCPPINDDCAAAIPLSPGFDMESGSRNTTNQGANPSPELPRPACAYAFFGNFGKDVWYTVAVPDSGNITIQTGAANATETMNLLDTALQLYSGDCNALTAIECNGSGSDNVNSFASVALTGRTPGEVLYIRAYGTWGTQGAFVISAYDATLANSDFDNSGFMSYPNPVKDILNLYYTKAITSVRVFNLLGQEVISKSMNANYSKVDLSPLPEGTYLVKIFADDRTKTVKIIKE